MHGHMRMTCTFATRMHQSYAYPLSCALRYDCIGPVRVCWKCRDTCVRLRQKLQPDWKNPKYKNLVRYSVTLNGQLKLYPPDWRMKDPDNPFCFECSANYKHGFNCRLCGEVRNSCICFLSYPCELFREKHERWLSCLLVTQGFINPKTELLIADHIHLVR